MLKLGVGITGSFCNLNECYKVYEKLKEEYDLTFFISSSVQNHKNRFIDYNDYKTKLLSLGEVVEKSEEGELYGPKKPLDLFLLMPASATSIGKLVNGIYDSAPLMALKAHLRNNKPSLIGIASNDNLAISGKNIFSLLNYKNIFFIPFKQDDPLNKPNSLVADFKLANKCLKKTLKYQQEQPILL